MTGRSPGLVVLIVAGVLVLLAWFAFCLRYVAHPRLDPEARVDALYVLGPLETAIDPALALMERGVAPVMVATTSIDADGRAYFTQYCGRVTPTYRIECVLPDPYTTWGEAKLLGTLARERGWRRVAILASTPQAERARALAGRCIDADVLVWDHPQPRRLTGWLAQFVHQSGGWVQLLATRGC